ncbi:hypothetical protein V8B97DRAFT_2026819 [Scleroderma yunnanense]
MKESVSNQVPKVIWKHGKLSKFQIPIKDGILDRQLRTSEKNAFCETCGMLAIDCVGHYACIKLVNPVFHIEYFKHMISILQHICKPCACVLLNKPERSFLEFGVLKINYNKFHAKKTAGEMEKWKHTFAPVVKAQKELGIYPKKAVCEELNPLKVLDLFHRILDGEYIWQNISIPLVCIRPSVVQDGTLNEDDLTVKLVEIVFMNALIQQGLSKGAPTAQFVKHWEFLQLSLVVLPVLVSHLDLVHTHASIMVTQLPQPTNSNTVTMYINSKLPGVPLHAGQNPMRSFMQCLKGKQGHFFNFSGHTLISVDPNLHIDEVTVLKCVARILMNPECVTSHNIKRLCQAVQNGCDVHPNANYVTAGIGSFKKFLSVCGLYNADFDGNKINLYIPQIEQACTEALELMTPVITAIQDFITASYLLLKGDTFFDQCQFTQIYYYFADANLQIDLPLPMIWKPKYAMKLLPDISPNNICLVIVNGDIMCGKKMNFGFLLDINNTILRPILISKKDIMVEKVYTECDNLTTQAKKGLLENKPRCNQEQTLEVLISSVLSKVHDEVRKICMTELSHHNAPLIMVTCGLKGFIINVCQVVACVGQQIIIRKCAPDRFQDHLLPHFPKNFYTGLLPTEFLFQTISGHEGLVDMVVNTAETGYMQCQLMKALEDLMTLYNLSVCSSAGGTVQFRHGDDGLDPTSLKGDAPPIEFDQWKEELDIHLCHSKFTSEYTAAYIDTICRFFIDNAVYPLAMLCKACGMFEVLECFNEWDREPGTQMTLKTFQFAGVTSMNVILSVPCIKETINTTKAISTPIISCKLITMGCGLSACIMKGRLEKLIWVAAVLEEAWTPKHTHISVIIDMEAISKL